MMFGKYLNLFVIDPHRVREPNIVADPIHFLQVSDVTMTEFLQAELFLVFDLS
jgi:hypothetical protein